MTNSGIQLALLEGMDETLLVQLHESGITTRDGLESALALPAGRRELAERLGVPVVRLEALHHLNFVLPEERVARLVFLEQETRRNAEEQSRSLRGLRVLIGVLAVGLLALAAYVITRQAQSDPPTPTQSGASDSLRTAVEDLRLQVSALAPLAKAQARADLQSGLAQLGPAPGWNGRLVWPMERHRRVAAALRSDPATGPERAASLALAKLAELEGPLSDTLTPLARAERAAELVQEFPDPGIPQDTGTAAALSVRSRLRARALGLTPLEETDPRAAQTLPWSWSAPEFTQCELLLARLEALPVQGEALPVWSETMAALRTLANRGRDQLGDHPSAWARHYWLRRGELEMAVVAALLGRPSLAPYHGTSPTSFLAQRTQFLRESIAVAPDAAKAPLRWLLVEHEEARLLLEWLAEDPARAERARGQRWVEALHQVEQRRAQERYPTDAALTQTVTEAVREVGSQAEPFAAGRTRWEAGLRPLLMATRAAALPPSAPTPGS